MTDNTTSSQFQVEDIQSFIYLGYRDLKSSAYLLCRFKNEAIEETRKWLKHNLNFIQTLDKGHGESALNIAFTKEGLVKLGVDNDELHTFSIPFIEGMIARQKILGDFEQNDPSNWKWGNEKEDSAVDMLLMVFGKDPAALERKIDSLELNSAHINLAYRVDSSFREKEHFGFRDGITDVTTEGFLNHYLNRHPDNEHSGKAKFWDIHREDVLKDGEVLLGCINEYDEKSGSPLVKSESKYLSPCKSDSHASFKSDFGKNGTYLVFRQLEQDVSAFWSYADQQAKASNIMEMDAEYIASKMVGRMPDGTSFISKDENIRGFVKEDPDGLKCPFASHVRRSNPRDSMIQDKPEESLKAVRNHRIIRRGRSYGTGISDAQDMKDFIKDAIAASSGDKGSRGLNFICFNADISQQFEFIQQNWINNPKFLGLYNDPDPLVASLPVNGKTFSIPDHPFRKRLELQKNFVTVVGGAYFFMPGLNAIRYLAHKESLEGISMNEGKSFIDIGLSIY
ncbi:MAG: hypothetical protein J7604_06685 [Sporocytophaga sp.]|uniref:Dyp-type peroxidase n=1 Tax=Sporocytophaga sp. TaxID=2231183 RepID=UPI001B066C82|nr:hypothetical protein [Sporocytophaga sp.]MBO9699880.1 hypothetical protein [Sporocytophaga sp.]